VSDPRFLTNADRMANRPALAAELEAALAALRTAAEESRQDRAERERIAAEAQALAESARMGRRSGQIDAREVMRRHEEALAIARDNRDPLAIGAALTRLGSQAGAMGDTARSRSLLAEAVQVLEREPPGHDLAAAYAYRAEEAMFAGRVRDAMRFADRALEIPSEERDDELVVMCLHIRGDARCSLGDPSGLDDLREALRLAEAGGNAADVATSENYLGDWLWAMDGPAAGLARFDAALEIAQRRGALTQALWTRAASLGPLFDLGDWDGALARCDDILAVGSERLDGSLVVAVGVIRARIRLLREARAPLDEVSRLVGLARRVDELHALAPALALAAETAVARGDDGEASRYLHEFADETSGVAVEYRESQLPAIARACAATGETRLLERMLEASAGVARRGRLAIAAARAVAVEAAGNRAEAATMYARSAADWHDFGNVVEELEALLGERRCSTGDVGSGVGRRAAAAGGGSGRVEELLERLGLPTSATSLGGSRRVAP
jgi:tetratricopeptide (TPR) repeat protein